ncbi:family 2 encapsulin nanocompartment cargo protein terpene cyclase [Flindersiella endophytica]
MGTLLTRMSAPSAPPDQVELVRALLAGSDRRALEEPARLLADHFGLGRDERSSTEKILSGPTGLGTAALRLHPPSSQGSGADSTAEADDGADTNADDNDTTVPPLYCPPVIRDNPALGKEVNERLVAWAGEVGIYPGQLDKVRRADFGRLIMLTHPDCDDIDRLLAAAKCILAEWAVDDHYVDGEARESTPELLGQQLAIAYSAIDPVHLPKAYAPQLEAVLEADPVTVSLRSGIAHLSEFATPAQVARLRHELAIMFVAYNQEAVWRHTEQTPAVWEYLLHRSENSFLPPMVLIDAVGGYEVPPEEFADSSVRRLFLLAGLASVIVNDLYSMVKEDPTDTNLPRVIVAEEGCTLREAIRRTADIHDEVVHTFEEGAAARFVTASPALQRFLAGLWAWLGGGREWHSSSERYTAKAAA